MEQAVGAMQLRPAPGFDLFEAMVHHDPAAAIPRGKRILSQPRLDSLTQARTFNLLCYASACLLRRTCVEAAFHGHEAVRLAREIGGYCGQQILFDSQVNLGLALERIGEYSAAINHFREALTMPLDWLERRHREDSVLTHLGQAHYYNGEYEEALTAFDQAGAVTAKHEEKKCSNEMLHSFRGMCYLRMDDLDTAECYVTLAARAAAYEGFDEVRARSQIFSHMAICRMIARDWEEAEEYARLALDSSAEVGEPYGEVIGRLVLANCARRARRVQEAVELSAAASRIAFDYGYIPLLQEKVWLMGYLYG